MAKNMRYPPVLTTAILAALVLAAGAQSATTTNTAPLVVSHTYTHPNELVPVEGARRLNMLCMGQGAPTVMLVNGGDSNTMAWRRAQPRIAEFTRVCAYDKAGFGFSDAATHPSSVGHDVDDLHWLIEAAKIGKPVVLVGESLGGLDAVLFAGRYRNEVAGMVLTDPTTARVHPLVLASYSPKELAQFRDGYQKYLADYAVCLNLAKAGKLNHKTSKLRALDCLDSDYADDPVLQAELDRQEEQPKNQAAQRSEMENHLPLFVTNPSEAHGTYESENDREMAGASTNFGDMPIVVLSADVDSSCPHDPQCIAQRALVNAANDRVAHYSAKGKSIVVKGATHDIPDSRLDAVVDAVREVVEQVRERH